MRWALFSAMLAASVWGADSASAALYTVDLSAPASSVKIQPLPYKRNGLQAVAASGSVTLPSYTLQPGDVVDFDVTFTGLPNVFFASGDYKVPGLSYTEYLPKKPLEEWHGSEIAQTGGYQDNFGTDGVQYMVSAWPGEGYGHPYFDSITIPIGTYSFIFGAFTPEPGTWALMLLGVGWLGAAMRARRRGVAA